MGVSLKNSFHSISCAVCLGCRDPRGFSGRKLCHARCVVWMVAVMGDLPGEVGVHGKVWTI